MTFDQVAARWEWKPLRNCPGRYVLSDVPTVLRPQDLVGCDIHLSECHVATTRDIVVVASLDEGGLISYRRSNGTYVHTLNTTEGFERKLAQLGISTIGP